MEQLRGAPSPRTAKQIHLRMTEECLRRRSRKRSKSQEEAIPNRGPTTDKARLCLGEVQTKGTKRRPCSAECRECILSASLEHWRWGYRACQERQVRSPAGGARLRQLSYICDSLLRGSQWTKSRIELKMWSNFSICQQGRLQSTGLNLGSWARWPVWREQQQST